MIAQPQRSPIRSPARFRDWPKHCALGAIRLYQLTLGPYLGRQCRFYPSCSRYAQEAIAMHGVVRGCLLAARRLGRCHPLHAGGVDLVPDRKES